MPTNNPPVEVFKNFAQAVLANPVTTTPAAGTSETWTLVASSPLPAIGTGLTQQFRCQVNNVSGSVASPEIVIVTEILTSTTVQVTRGAEGSPVVTHLAGEVLVVVQTAAQMAPGAWRPLTVPYAGATGVDAGWAYAGVGIHPACRLRQDGDVELTGLLTNATASSASTFSSIAQLPFQPDNDHYLAPGYILLSSGAPDGLQFLECHSIDGMLKILPGGSGTATVSLLSLSGVILPILTI